MSILNYFPGLTQHHKLNNGDEDSRYSRDALGDLKHGMDLIFAFKKELDGLHPIAAETLIRLLSQ